MSNPNVQPAEPTMEEILASIRRIISEEATAPEPAAPAPQPEPVAAMPEPEEDILDLTDMVANEPEPLPVPEPMAAPVFQQAAYQPPPETRIPPAAPAPLVAANESDIVLVDNDMTRSNDDSLLSGSSLDRAGSAFSQLDRGMAISGGSDGRTIEDMIREMLKPMLKNWLEDHLPEMVERVVRDEVERAARRGRR